MNKAIVAHFVSFWRLIPPVRYVNFRKSYPNAGKGCWKQWVNVQRFWGGRIIHFKIRHHTLIFDFRHNYIADMVILGG
jgi:hypothetical protein